MLCRDISSIYCQFKSLRSGENSIFNPSAISSRRLSISSSTNIFQSVITESNCSILTLFNHGYLNRSSVEDLEGLLYDPEAYCCSKKVTLSCQNHLLVPIKAVGRNIVAGISYFIRIG